MRGSNAALLMWIAGLFTVGCASGDNSSQTSNNSNTSGVNVSVVPTSATVTVGQNTAFQAAVTGSTNTAVTWQVNGVAGGSTTTGTISTTGVYTAPGQVPNPSAVTVTAVSQADKTKSASAAVTVANSTPSQQAEHIPIELGVSGGNAKDSAVQSKLIYCCGGTLGSLVERGGTFYILSNTHILARSDQASLGESIIQPGLIDSNCSTSGTSTVGNLSQFVNLEDSSTNADAAIAEIVSGTVDTSGNILSLGATANGSTPSVGQPHSGNGIIANVGEPVAKSGRSSGLTCSTISAVHIATTISYTKSCNSTLTFTKNYTGQISVSGVAFSASGDSGSLIVDQNTADPVALLYGGSDTDTVANPVADVLGALQDSQGNRPTFVGSSSTHKVIGCTLTAASPTAQSAVTPTAAQITVAQRARDIHAPELLANPYIQAIGVGKSIDHPGEPAIILVVNAGQIPTPLPTELEGVATRVVSTTAAVAPHGIFDLDAAAHIAPVADTFAVSSISSSEMARAKTVHAAHVDQLLKQTGVQGVGITSSANAPGEAALMIFTIRGIAHDPIPAVIDGLRTRVRESSRFTAGQRGEQTGNGCPAPRVSHAESVPRA
jgi:hypothetical protein